jgi:DNA repair protein RecO (recombination protein O)
MRDIEQVYDWWLVQAACGSGPRRVSGIDARVCPLTRAHLSARRGTMARCRSTVTRRSSCAPTSWGRPTASSRRSGPHPGQDPHVAKGVRRTKSRFGARLEPFMVVDLQCYEGPQPRHRHPGRDPRATWRCDLPRLHGIHRGDGRRRDVRPADRGAAAGDPAVPPRVAGALAALAAGEHDPGLVLDAYLLRALAVAGWAPSFHDCAKCGAPGPHRAFNVAAGGPYARYAVPPARPRPAPDDAPAALGVAHRRLGARRCGLPVHRREGSGLVAAFLQWHLERGLCDPCVSWSARRDRPAWGSRARHGGGASGRTGGSCSVGRQGSSGIPAALPAPQRGQAARDPGRAGATTRGDRHGRQRPLGQPARATTHQRSRGGRGGAARRRRGGDRGGRDAPVGLCLLDRELAALARRGPLPHGVQPRRHPTAPRPAHEWGVRMRWVGRRPRLWRSVISELEIAQELTRHNTG